MIEISTPMKVHDKEFEVFINYQDILDNIKSMAYQINEDYQGRSPLFIGVLNGVFMFAADLMKEITVPSEISFIKLASYQDLASTGQVKELIGLKEDLSGKDVIIMEDIVDTGETMHHLWQQLKALEPRSVEIATLLLKVDVFKKDIPLKYVGFKIPEKFVIGYGLDYNGHGRNLKDIYQIKE
ncbi:MAG: hypoxanthine phosphoribosyltransferase [Cyclobacteriaceae bacterium]|nr:hypoxanthine phosphoribosyltransferase [Cyclobacteriaceae bacterium]